MTKGKTDTTAYEAYKRILEVANDTVLLEIGRKAVEDVLVDYRDSRIGQFQRGNGLVIKESNGTPSNIIRIGTEDALRIGLQAIAKYMEKSNAR